ncbi:MAG: hypothetical protein K0B02_02195 [DPANN group archaeon]|nr:hypothetical protein [DPANN group archaeon]
MEKKYAIIAIILLILTATISSVSAMEQKVIMIPYYISQNTPFFACAKLDNSICIEGTEQFTYTYGSTTYRELRPLEEIIEPLGFDYYSEYWCKELNPIYAMTDFPKSDTTVTKGSSTVCEIDYVNYTIDFLEYTNPSFKIKYHTPTGTVTDWYNLTDTIILDTTTNKKIWFRAIRIGASTFLDLSCNSDANILMPISKITINGSCEDKDIAEHNLQWSETETLVIDNVTIIFETNTSQLNYSILQEQNMTITATLFNKNGEKSTGNIYYSLRSITGPVFIKGELILNTTSQNYYNSIYIPPEYPVGIIELEAKDISGYTGGIKTIYKTIPYDFNLSIADDNINTDFNYFIKDQVPITFEIDNKYGTIYNITGTLKYLNTTSSENELTDLNMQNNGGKYLFNIPGDQPGEYIIEINVKHSTGYNMTYYRYLHVMGFSFELFVPKTWIQGDIIEIFTWVEDARNVSAKSIDSNITYSKIRKPSGSEDIITEEPKAPTDYKHKFYYTTLNSTELGFYTVTIKATDIYNYSYEKSYPFYLGTNYKNEFIEITKPPELNVTTFKIIEGNITIKNIKNTKIYDINVKVNAFSEYLSVNISDMQKDLESQNTTNFKYIIIPDKNIPSGNNTGEIEITVNNVSIRIPIEIEVDLKGYMTTTPTKVEFDTITQTTISKSINLKNTGYLMLKNVNVELTGNITNHSTIIFTEKNITIGNDYNIELNFNFNNPGYYEGLIKVKSETSETNQIKIKITVYNNLDSNIESMFSEISNLQINLTELETYNINLYNLTERMINIIGNHSELEDYYDAKNYSESKKIYDQLQIELNAIKSEYNVKYQEFQKSQQPVENDGFCEAKELCSSQDCMFSARCNPVVCGDDICDLGECTTCPTDCNPIICNTAVQTDDTTDSITNKKDDNTSTSSSSIIKIVMAIFGLIILIVVATSIIPIKNTSTNDNNNNNNENNTGQEQQQSKETITEKIEQTVNNIKDKINNLLNR